LGFDDGGDRAEQDWDRPKSSYMMQPRVHSGPLSLKLLELLIDSITFLMKPEPFQPDAAGCVCPWCRRRAP